MSQLRIYSILTPFVGLQSLLGHGGEVCLLIGFLQPDGSLLHKSLLEVQLCLFIHGVCTAWCSNRGHVDKGKRTAMLGVTDNTGVPRGFPYLMTSYTEPRKERRVSCDLDLCMTKGRMTGSLLNVMMMFNGR